MVERSTRVKVSSKEELKDFNLNWIGSRKAGVWFLLIIVVSGYDDGVGERGAGEGSNHRMHEDKV